MVQVSVTACDCHMAANDLNPSACTRAFSISNGNALKKEKKHPLNVAGNYCDYSGVYDGGALQRTVLNWGLAGIEAARY